VTYGPNGNCLRRLRLGQSRAGRFKTNEGPASEGAVGVQAGVLDGAARVPNFCVLQKGTAMPFVARAVVSGLSRPVFACAPAGDLGRLFIVEQGGRIRILDLTATPPTLNPAPFLQIGGLSTGNEQGLLGLAFHPNYAANGVFFVNYNDAAGEIVIARYAVAAAAPNEADPASARVVLKAPQPFANHNGGWLGFGPDGFLYVALGDGGAGNDPGNRAQSLGELLGKLLRLDVDGDDFPADPNRNYAIPATNPFIHVAGARPEIWAYGLRNPWRCAFDRKTGELYIADVGQDDWEEVNVQPAGQGGQNYGWRLREGRHDTGLGAVGGAALTDPVHEYDHGQGLAIVGGYVYRGARAPGLEGTYFFADYTGPIWTLRFDGGAATPATNVSATLFPGGGPTSITSFGEDATGELYLLNRAPGTVYRIEPVAAPAAAALAAAAPRKRAAAVQAVTWGKPKTIKKVQGKRPKSMLEMETAAAAGVLEPSAPGTPVEEARALLQAAAAIEHMLLVEYLYALYSLDKFSPGSALADPLKAIAVEEMGHFITVQNLLMAIGGEPYFARESPLPKNDPFFFRLQPLSLTSLAKYVTAESPLAEQIKDPVVLARAKRAYALTELAASSGSGVLTPGINHVGVLYSKLYWLFQSSDAVEGPWNNPPPCPFASGHIPDVDIVGATNYQVSALEIGSGTPGEGSAYVAPVTNRADALAALHQIASQGEGWVADDQENSHFERFLDAFEALARFVDIGAEPTLPVPTDPTTGDESPSAQRNRITHPSSRLWAELCDVRYQMLIGELWLAVLLPANDPANPRAQLFRKSVHTEMKKGVAAVARKLATLPRKGNYDPAQPGNSARVLSAGAPFGAIPHDQLPSDIAGWKQYLRDRITATELLRARLESSENTIPLVDDDRIKILNPLQKSDSDPGDGLLKLLGP
jgi:glucose/arabinose dehydrogenase